MAFIKKRLAILGGIFERCANISLSSTRTQIDHLEVPEHLRDLIPLAELWGIGDDVVRNEIWQGATPQEKKDLKYRLQGRIEEITQWLDELDKTGSATSAAGYFMFLLEGLDESDLWPD